MDALRTQGPSSLPVSRRRIGAGLLALAAASCVAKRGAPTSGADGPAPAARDLPAKARPGRARILCLHGYHGSASALRAQMGSLVEELEPLAELVFADAPSLAASDYGWWHAVRRESSGPSDDPGVMG